MTPPKRPPVGECTGCKVKASDVRRLAMCKDCGYQACGSCESHHSRGAFPRCAAPAGPGPAKISPLCPVVPPPPCPAGTEAWPRGPPPLVHHVVGETSVGTTCRAGALTRPRRAHRDVLLPKLQLWQEILPHGAPLVPLERPRPRVHGRPPPRDPRHGVCNRGVRARPARVRQLRNGHEGLHEGIP